MGSIYNDLINEMFGEIGPEDTQALEEMDIFPHLDNNPDKIPPIEEMGQGALF